MGDTIKPEPLFREFPGGSLGTRRHWPCWRAGRVFLTRRCGVRGGASAVAPYLLHCNLGKKPGENLEDFFKPEMVIFWTWFCEAEIDGVVAWERRSCADTLLTYVARWPRVETLGIFYARVGRIGGMPRIKPYPTVVDVLILLAIVLLVAAALLLPAGI